MDERQSQIREGAGLEESRINTDFLEWLQKWGTPILLVGALIVGGIALTRFIERSRVERVNVAFNEYEELVSSGIASPSSLRRVAQEYDSVRGIGLMARLQEADLYMTAVAAGIQPDALTQIAFGDPEADDLLDAEDRAWYVNEARELYETVLRRAGNDPAKALHAIGAIFGLASVAIAEEDFEAATERYKEAAERAEATAFNGLARIARKRAERLPELHEAPRLYAAEELAIQPEDPMGAAPGGMPMEIPDLPDGIMIDPETGEPMPIPEELEGLPIPGTPGTPGSPETPDSPGDPETGDGQGDGQSDGQGEGGEGGDGEQPPPGQGG